MGKYLLFLWAPGGAGAADQIGTTTLPPARLAGEVSREGSNAKKELVAKLVNQSS